MTPRPLNATDRLLLRALAIECGGVGDITGPLMRADSAGGNYSKELGRRLGMIFAMADAAVAASVISIDDINGGRAAKADFLKRKATP